MSAVLPPSWPNEPSVAGWWFTACLSLVAMVLFAVGIVQQSGPVSALIAKALESEPRSAEMIQPSSFSRTQLPAEQPAVVQTPEPEMRLEPSQTQTLPDAAAQTLEPELAENPLSESQLTQEPVAEAEPELTQEPVVGAEPELTQKQTVEADPQLTQEPVVEADSELTQEPVVEADSELTQEQAVEAEPELTQEQVVEAEPERTQEPVAVAEPERTQEQELDPTLAAGSSEVAALNIDATPASASTESASGADEVSSPSDAESVATETQGIEQSLSSLRETVLTDMSRVSRRISFRVAGSVLMPDSERLLEQVFEDLFLYAESSIVIEVASADVNELANPGSVDSVSAESNEALSFQRASVIRQYLVDRGLEEDRLIISTLPASRAPNGGQAISIQASLQ